MEREIQGKWWLAPAWDDCFEYEFLITKSVLKRAKENKMGIPGGDLGDVHPFSPSPTPDFSNCRVFLCDLEKLKN